MPTNTVPRLIKYIGAPMDERGYPITVPVEVTFSLYDTASPTQKSALWKETQRVSPNEKGQYTIYLGEVGSQGLPPEVFNSLSAQWLGVEVEGDAELPRTVQLPDWFEVENTDFRYQLTVIGGQFAQAIIAKKVAHNQFTIATNAPHVEVSWQVTAKRNDPYMKAHPFVVEQQKPASKRGHYDHPKFYGEALEAR